MSDDKKFAKLFEFDGDQVLVMKEIDENGNPSISFTCHVFDLAVTPKFSFKQTDKGFSERDRMFNDCDQAMAFGIRDKMINQFGSSGQDEGQGQEQEDVQETTLVSKPSKKRKPTH